MPSPDKKKVTPETLGLVEVGPRITLNPIKILEGSFGGPVIYSNPDYVSPNLVVSLSSILISFAFPVSQTNANNALKVTHVSPISIASV